MTKDQVFAKMREDIVLMERGRPHGEKGIFESRIIAYREEAIRSGFGYDNDFICLDDEFVQKINDNF